MSYFVATEDFVDPTDGVPIKKGVTYVSAEADCFRLHPEKFKPVERSARVSGLMITRVGGVASLAGHSVSPPRPQRVQGAAALPRRTTANERPLDYTHTELLERYIDYTVALGPSARQTIIDEIERTMREVGSVETGGWLYGQYVPSEATNFATIAFASGPLPGSRASSRTLEIGDPREALARARDAGLGEPWEVIGDWHCHTIRGSELPSQQDARAWAGTMDSLGREGYVSVIVSPSPEMGWMVPKFSAWVAGRHGVPSKPLVGRARVAW